MNKYVSSYRIIVRTKERLTILISVSYHSGHMERVAISVLPPGKGALSDFGSIIITTPGSGPVTEGNNDILVMFGFETITLLARAFRDIESWIKDFNYFSEVSTVLLSNTDLGPDTED